MHKVASAIEAAATAANCRISSAARSPIIGASACDFCSFSRALGHRFNGA